MSNTPTMILDVGVVEKQFPNKTGAGQWKIAQKIFIRNDTHKYIMCWDHDEYFFKEGQKIITQNLTSKEYQGVKTYSAGKNAGLETYEDPSFDDITDRKIGSVTVKDNITPKSTIDYPVKIYQVKVTLARNYNSVTFGVELPGTLDEAKREFDILKEEAIKKLNEIS